MKTRVVTYLTLLVLAALCFSQEPAADPWPTAAIIEPADFAAALKADVKHPTILCVAFPTLYNSKHITDALFFGQGSKPEGIEALKKAVAGWPKDKDIVMYCGCCPMKQCPNIRPAYRTLKELGFTNVRVLVIPTNMQTDWYSKNYPFEPGAAAR